MKAEGSHVACARKEGKARGGRNGSWWDLANTTEEGGSFVCLWGVRACGSSFVDKRISLTCCIDQSGNYLDCVVSRIVRRRAGFESNPCGNDVYKRMMCVFQCCENKRCGVSCGVVLNQQRRMVAVTWKGHCAVRTIDIYRKIMRVRGTWSSVRRAERNGACCLRSINLILAWERIFWHFGE